MREQQKSKLPKKGEGTIHFKAKERLGFILEKRDWICLPEAYFYASFKLEYPEYPPSTIYKSSEYRHHFDIYAYKHHDNGLTSEMLLEIDGSSHNSQVQQGKDRTAQEYAAFFLPDARFVRLDIAMLLNYSISDQSICDLYNIK